MAGIVNKNIVRLFSIFLSPFLPDPYKMPVRMP
jgi:hypothetical protein